MILLGIDYGERKTGLAIARGGLVEPLQTVKTKDLFSLIIAKYKEEKIEKVVLGISEGGLTGKIKSFKKKLKKKLPIEIEFSDETLTTLDAKKILGKIKRKKRYKRKMEDAVAAAVMLEYYLEREKGDV